MFLSMLTADAAAQHGHEYSNLRVEGTQRRSPLPRYPFSAITTNRQRQLHGFSPLGPGKRPKPPARSQSVKVTMAELRDVPDAANTASDDKSVKLQLPGTYPSETSSVEDSPTEEPGSIGEEISPDGEEDITPAPTPRIQIEDTVILPLPKRAPRPKCQYRLAHPPPTVAPKKLQHLQKHIRPKVLLQLQQRIPSGFHKPVYEVVPASRFSTDTRLGKKLNRLRKGKDGLHPDDLVVMKVEDYKDADDASEEAEFSETRTALGIISVSHSPDGQAEDKALLQLENSTWIATAGKFGGYDLVLQEDESQKAKWFIQKSKRKRPNSIAGLPNPALSDDQKFYFALMQPFSRQHPTIASINATSLDIYDYYAAPSSTPRTPTRPSSVIVDGDASPQLSTPVNEDERIPTNDLLRKLIVISGAWLFFTNGWSPFFRYFSSPRPSTTRDAEPKSLHTRAMSLPISSLIPPACSRRMQRDSSPSSISKTSSRSSTVQPVSEESTPSSTSNDSSALTSAPSDVSTLPTEVTPSPVERTKVWPTEPSEALHSTRKTSRETTESAEESGNKRIIEIQAASKAPLPTAERPKISRDDSSSDSDIPLQSPSYWQAYDLFQERSFMRKLERVHTPTVISREVSSSSEVPPKPEREEVAVAEEEEVAPEPKPLRRASTLRNRVVPYLSRIKFATQKRVGS